MTMRAYAGTADAQITKRNSGSLMGATLVANTTNDARLVLYDENDSSKTASKKILEVAIDTSIEGNGTNKDVLFPEPVKYNTGLYADITGTSANFIVYYK